MVEMGESLAGSLYIGSTDYVDMDGHDSFALSSDYTPYGDWRLKVYKDGKEVTKNSMNPIKNIFLDKRTKKFIKAGILDNCLELTSEGRKVLYKVMFEAMIKEMEAEADEIIAEKEDKE